jgi:thiol-disulfide isomerase/thioredoxin
MPNQMRSHVTRNVVLAIVGAVILVTVVYMSIYANNPFSQIFSVGNTVGNPNSLQRQLADENKTRVPAPEIVGIQQWLNTPDGKGLSLAELRGKVVLIDFWTYSCINCIRTLPYVTAWDQKYRDKGLVIIGVHTPEFNFEKDVANVQRAMAQYNIQYPVALDNDYATWHAYDNLYWPAKYFIDAEGNIAGQHFGEGSYEETERTIQRLLMEAGTLAQPVAPEAISDERTSQRRITPEIYFGYQRIDHFGQSVVRNKPFIYTSPAQFAPSTFYLSGTWQVGPESAESVGNADRIIIRYDASQANLVLSAAAKVRGVVTIDGQPVSNQQAGTDIQFVDGQSVIDVFEPRLYNVIRTQQQGEHVLIIEFSGPGVEAFTFTFG